MIHILRLNLVVLVAAILAGCAVTVGPHTYKASHPQTADMYCLPCIEATDHFGWGVIWIKSEAWPLWLGYFID